MISAPTVFYRKQFEKLEFVVPTVGACIARPAAPCHLSALVFGEFAALYRRTTNGRPYVWCMLVKTIEKIFSL